MLRRHESVVATHEIISRKSYSLIERLQVERLQYLWLRCSTKIFSRDG